VPRTQTLGRENIEYGGRGGVLLLKYGGSKLAVLGHHKIAFFLRRRVKTCRQGTETVGTGGQCPTRASSPGSEKGKSICFLYIGHCGRK